MDNVDELYGNMIVADDMDNSADDQDTIDEVNDYNFYTTRLINCASRRISRYELFDLLQYITAEDSDFWMSMFRSLIRVYSMTILEDYSKDIYTQEIVDDIKHLLIFLKVTLPDVYTDEKLVDKEINREDILVKLTGYNIPRYLELFFRLTDNDDYIKFIAFTKRESNTDYSETI